MSNMRRLLLGLFVGVLSVAILKMGAIHSADQYLYHLRNVYIPTFAYSYDDYLPYLSLVLLLGLKFAGVRSRNSWKPFLTSMFFSIALALIIVLSMKSLSGVLRPDGSDFFSFPSGHTVTAFLTASLLYKEYGFKKGAWVTAAIYAPAVVTGLTRILNNRHWLSDVSAGAIISLMIVGLGYYLTSLIFRSESNI